MYTEPLQMGMSLPDSSGMTGTKNSIFFMTHVIKKGYLSTQERSGQIKG